MHRFPSVTSFYRPSFLHSFVPDTSRAPTRAPSFQQLRPSSVCNDCPTRDSQFQALQLGTFSSPALRIPAHQMLARVLTIVGVVTMRSRWSIPCCFVVLLLLLWRRGTSRERRFLPVQRSTFRLRFPSYHVESRLVWHCLADFVPSSRRLCSLLVSRLPVRNRLQTPPQSQWVRTNFQSYDGTSI